MYVFYNNNPKGKKVGDCVIRSISVALGQPWEQTYTELCAYGYDMRDLPNSNPVWAAYLKDKGFKRYIIPDTCPDCYTIGQFAEDNQSGVYIVATGSHVVCVSDGGKILDNWDSSGEIPTYFFKKERE